MLTVFLISLTIVYPHSGPPQLQIPRLSASIASAIDLASREAVRQPSAFSAGAVSSACQDPDPIVLASTSGPAPAHKDDLSGVWKLLPALQSVPEELLRNLPPQLIFDLNRELRGDMKAATKLAVGARLALNAQKVSASPMDVGAGKDDRRDILHPGRFLPGAVCTVKEQWLMGRRIYGEKGQVALASYDLDSLGCGGCITAKGWEAIHNPGSQELKLRLFHLPNVTNTGLSAKKLDFESGEEAFGLGESLKEIADMESFRTALNTAREALHSVMPWNRSISAIVGFMSNSNYMFEELKGNPRRAAVLTEFVDYIFGRNAQNWVNNTCFITADEMAHVWSQWKGKRAVLFVKPRETPSQKQGQGTNICRRYQAGLCPKQGEKECKSTFGTTLKHVCNKFVGRGKMCEKDHPRKDHK